MPSISTVSVSCVKLQNYRNHAALRLDIAADAARPVVLTGANGAGKTNILEALSFFAPGRGLRHATLDAVARSDGPGGWAAHLSVQAGRETLGLGTGLIPGQESARREARLDGGTLSGPGRFGDLLSLIWLTPAMDRLFLEGASGRRRFLDRFTGQLNQGHAEHLADYDKAMRDRLRLLTEQGYLGADPAWLTALEARMAEAAQAIAQARENAVMLLRDAVADAADKDFPDADISLIGWPHEAEDGDSFATSLKKARMGDARAGKTEQGPHRTDVNVTYCAKNRPAADCSTGEQKALLFALVLGQADVTARVRGQAPLILLDEVAAHLDSGRRAGLFKRLDKMGGQPWVTGTDPGLFGAVAGHGQFFEIGAGSARLIDASQWEDKIYG